MLTKILYLFADQEYSYNKTKFDLLLLVTAFLPFSAALW